MSLVEIDVEVKVSTDKALLVSDGKTECWIPRSQIQDYSGDDDSPDTILLHEWYATHKGLT